MELLLIARRATSNLEGRGARVERVYCGAFMTSLDMAGASVTVMRVDALSLARYVAQPPLSLTYASLLFKDVSCFLDGVGVGVGVWCWCWYWYWC